MQTSMLMVTLYNKVHLLTLVNVFLFVINIFYLFSHTTSQHNIHSKQTKHNKTKQQTYTPYSKSPIKSVREREIKKQTKKVIPLYNNGC